MDTVLFWVGTSHAPDKGRRPRLPHQASCQIHYSLNSRNKQERWRWWIQPMQWAHYIDDTMLTCEGLPRLQDTRQTLLQHL